LTAGPLTAMLTTRRPLKLDGAVGTELDRRGVAAIVGECCGTTPTHLQAVRKEIAFRKPEGAK
jgi:methionine synthase I (cobalamin-dependent)